MKQQELNLTDEEKINFLATLKTNNQILDAIKNKISDMKFLLPISTTIACTLAILAGIFILRASPLPLVSAVLSASVTLIGIFEIYGAILLSKEKKEFNKLSNGKISYSKYKQLVKSGELAKWEEQFKDQVLNKVEEIKGIKHEKYTKSVEKEIFTQVKNSLPKDTSLDSEKIAQEVKKIIESNNTKANQYNDLQR